MCHVSFSNLKINIRAEAISTSADDLKKNATLTESHCVGQRPGPWNQDAQTSEPPTTAVHPLGCHPVSQSRQSLRPWRGSFKL